MRVRNNLQSYGVYILEMMVLLYDTLPEEFYPPLALGFENQSRSVGSDTGLSYAIRMVIAGL